MAGAPCVSVDYKGITIEGVRIARPSRLAPGQWLDFWDRVAALADGPSYAPGELASAGQPSPPGGQPFETGPGGD